MHSNRTGMCCLLLAAWSLEGCVHWKTHDLVPVEVLARAPSRARLERIDGSRLVLMRPRVLGDSVLETPRTGRAASRGRLRAMALTDVRAVALRRFNPLGTVLLTLTGAAVSGFLVFAAMMSGRAD
jgi:hypothetical protein